VCPVTARGIKSSLHPLDRWCLFLWGTAMRRRALRFRCSLRARVFTLVLPMVLMPQALFLVLFWIHFFLLLIGPMMAKTSFDQRETISCFESFHLSDMPFTLFYLRGIRLGGLRPCQFSGR